MAKDRRIRMVIEMAVDQEACDEHGVSPDDVLTGLTAAEGETWDGVAISTSLPGCKNTEDFFLLGGDIISAEFINDGTERDPIPLRSLSDAEKAELRERYPVGTVLVVDRMEDMQAPPKGTRGTVTHIDDAGNINMRWETGGSLSLIRETDKFHFNGFEKLERDEVGLYMFLVVTTANGLSTEKWMSAASLGELVKKVSETQRGHMEYAVFSGKPLDFDTLMYRNKNQKAGE